MIREGLLSWGLFRGNCYHTLLSWTCSCFFWAISRTVKITKITLIESTHNSVHHYAIDHTKCNILSRRTYLQKSYIYCHCVFKLPQYQVLTEVHIHLEIAHSVLEHGKLLLQNLAPCYLRMSIQLHCCFQWAAHDLLQQSSLTLAFRASESKYFLR